MNTTAHDASAGERAARATDVDVLVLGAGVTGLRAALEVAREGLTVRVCEARERAGGHVRTEVLETAEGRWILDAGPDGVVRSKPAALELLRELGLGSQVLSQGVLARGVLVARGGTLHRMPEGVQLVTPTKLLPLLRTPLLSPRAKLRVLGELFVAPSRDAGAVAARDESIGAFVRRRFGDEMASLLADSILAGIFAGDADLLSVRSTFPQLVELEQRHASLLRAVISQGVASLGAGASREAPGPFASLPDGMQSLVDALVRALPEGSLALGEGAQRIERSREGFTVHGANGSVLRARGVLLAVPPPVSAALLAPHDETAAGLLREIPMVSSAAVLLGYGDGPAARALREARASGFVVPRGESGVVSAATFLSEKWPGRAPSGCAIVRVFLGGARAPDHAERSDEVLTRDAREALARYLSIDLDEAPRLTRVCRWIRANPQPVLGHRARLERVHARVRALGPLRVAGGGYDGVGIPDCVAQGARAAAELIARLRSTAEGD